MSDTEEPVESQSLRQGPLWQLQSDPPPRNRDGDLHESQAQAAAGV